MRKHLSERALHLCMALGLILAGSTGCSDNEEIPEPQPLPVEFKLESKTVFVSCDGDEQSVNYTVENGLKNATIKVTADREWILDPQAADGKITFTVELSSEEQTREATVTTVYEADGTDPIEKSFKVVQEAYDAPFKVSVDAVTPVSATISLTVSDPRQPYLILYSPKDQLGKLTPDEVIRKQLEYYEAVAPAIGQTYREVLQQALKAGNFSGEKITGLLPGSETLVLIAGVDLDGKITTRVCVKEFSTESVETTDMTFDFRTQIDGTSVTIDVLPGDKEQYYYSYYLEKSEVTQQGVNPAAELQRSLSEIVELYYTYGLPADQAVMALCQKGDFQLTGTELEPNTVYLVVGIAVNNEGYVMSDLVQAEFTTGSPAPVDPSDNRITIEAANLTPTTVDLRITTTNKDPYLVYIFLQSEVANLSEEAIIEKTLQRKKYAHLREGDTTVKYYNREPNTSYVCVAMGYQSQQVTTKLFRCDFTTPSAGSAAAARSERPLPGAPEFAKLLRQRPALLPDGGIPKAAF